jgi:ammonia channel protein AmtB
VSIAEHIVSKVFSARWLIVVTIAATAVAMTIAKIVLAFRLGVDDAEKFLPTSVVCGWVGTIIAFYYAARTAKGAASEEERK